MKKNINKLLDFMNLIDKAVKLSKTNISDLTAIKELGEGWVAEEAFAIAIYSCLKYSNSIEDSLICAINHDGDSDSTGSVTGNIIGAYLGYSKIPSYFIKHLELHDIILELADDLSVKVPINDYSTKDDKYWESKYCKCNRDLKQKKKFLFF